jgi:uncharacterized protein YxjI
MLDRNAFVVNARFVKSSKTYDIVDPESGVQFGIANEQIGLVKELLRLVLPKQFTSAVIDVRTTPGDWLVFSVRRRPYLFRPRVDVLDANGALAGYYVSKVFSVGGGFHIYNKNNKHVAELSGKAIAFDFRFTSVDGAVEMGRVSKDLSLWSLVKDLFTSADVYAVEVSPRLTGRPAAKMLILGAALAIDAIYRQENRSPIKIGNLLKDTE